MSLPIPVSTVAGTYYLIAKSDTDNAIGEASETDNTRGRIISITAP